MVRYLDGLSEEQMNALFWPDEYYRAESARSERGGMIMKAAIVERYNRMSGLSIQLITQNGAAFEGRKSRGMFVGVQNYFAIVRAESDFRMEKEGYYGEKLVLEATLRSIGTEMCSSPVMILLLKMSPSSVLPAACARRVSRI